MAVKQRPGFEVSVERTTEATKSKSVFYDIKPGQNVNLRFLPPDNAEGRLFFESAQHFNFKLEGEKRTWACLRVHGDGTEECPACVLVEKAEAADDDRFKKIIREHNMSPRWHAQVLVLPKPDDKDEEGNPVGVKQINVVGLSKGTAQKVANILKMEKDNRQALLTDPDKGQAVNVSRNDKSGLQTRYEVQATGLRVPLDEVYPKWTDEFLDIQKAIGLRITTAEEMSNSIQETIGNNLFKALLGDVEFAIAG